MASRASNQDFVASSDDAFFVGSRAYGEVNRPDRASLASMDLHAALYPAHADRVINTSALVAAYKAQASTPSKPDNDGPATRPSYAASELHDLSLLARQVMDCQDQIERLEASKKSIIEQRDQWRARAQLAEAQIANTSRSGAPPEDKTRYQALKHHLAKMLHPDSTARSVEDKSACDALFIAIWTAIDQIERSGGDAR